MDAPTHLRTLETRSHHAGEIDPGRNGGLVAGAPAADKTPRSVLKCQKDCWTQLHREAHEDCFLGSLTGEEIGRGHGAIGISVETDAPRVWLENDKLVFDLRVHAGRLAEQAVDHHLVAIWLMEEVCTEKSSIGSQFGM